MDLPAPAVIAELARLVLWRHGESEWNRMRRCQGQVDVPLSGKGVAQARAAARPLADALHPTLIVSSDLRRAYDTARPLAGITGLPITVDRGLREVSKGRWEGLTHAEIALRYPDELAAWQHGRETARGGGETTAGATVRAVAAVLAAFDSQPSNCVVVACTHGGLIRLLIGHLLGLPDWRVVGPLDNTATAILARIGIDRWQMLAHNVIPGADGTLERR